MCDMLEKMCNEAKEEQAKEMVISLYAEHIPFDTIVKCVKYPVEVVRTWLKLDPA